MLIVKGITSYFCIYDLSHHRTCGFAYGGSYFEHHSE